MIDTVIVGVKSKGISIITLIHLLDTSVAIGLDLVDKGPIYQDWVNQVYITHTVLFWLIQLLGYPITLFLGDGHNVIDMRLHYRPEYMIISLGTMAVTRVKDKN